jgi:hypothetical protein
MSDKTNLLGETLAALHNHGLTTKDVLWVGSADGKMAMIWEEFEPIAEMTDYNSDYGSPKIAQDLIVVGSNWWLERGEYDGSEWWEYKSMPDRAHKPKRFSHVCVNDSPNEDISCGWESLARINDLDRPLPCACTSQQADRCVRLARQQDA